MDRISMTLLMCLVLMWATGCSSEQGASESSSNSASNTTDPAEATGTEEPFLLEEDFTQLTLDDFQVFPEPEEGKEPIWRSHDGSTIFCSGLQRGYAYTKKVYRNFTLRLDFRFPTVKADSDKPPNTGFLIYMPEEQKVWPASLEVQGRQDELGQIKSNSRDLTVVVQDDEQARLSSRKSPGEWNRIEIASHDGALTSLLNGTKIGESEPTELTSGFIGLQSEGFEVEFRRIRIREE